MGMESFYVNFHMKNNTEYELLNMNISWLDVGDKDIYFTVSYALISFFDGICQIYAFIDMYRNEIKLIESMKVDITDSMDTFKMFLEKMIGLWDEKIRTFQQEYGMLLIGPNEEFFKKYKKLKKHMKFLN